MVPYARPDENLRTEGVWSLQSNVYTESVWGTARLCRVSKACLVAIGKGGVVGVVEQALPTETLLTKFYPCKAEFVLITQVGAHDRRHVIATVI